MAEPAEAAAAPEMPEKAVQEPKAAQLPQATEPPEPEDDEPELTPEQRAAAERRKAEITRTVQVSIEQIEDAEAEQAEKEADTPESTGSKVGRAVRLLIGWLLLVVLLAGMIAAGGIYWLYKKSHAGYDSCRYGNSGGPAAGPRGVPLAGAGGRQPP